MDTEPTEEGRFYNADWVDVWSHYFVVTLAYGGNLSEKMRNLKTIRCAKREPHGVWFIPDVLDCTRKLKQVVPLSAFTPRARERAEGILNAY